MTPNLKAQMEKLRPNHLHWRKECDGLQCGAKNSWNEGFTAAHDILMPLIEEMLEVLNGPETSYNSVRESLALMAEGEGNDPKIYQEIARHALRKLDPVLAKVAEVLG